MAENTEAKNEKSETALREEATLNFWEEKNIFQKSVFKKAPRGEFTFYDGPPFANGLPHYGHIVPSIIKDLIPRYKTMQGYSVRRRWGWDCHGLPVENLVEKELNLKAKKDIVEFGLQKFNQKAGESVMRYADDWRKVIPRLGRWVDMEDDYRTMDPNYTESVWWVFKTLYDKNLIYEGFKSMHLCPHCETTLSNFEVSQGYLDVTDLSVTAKFKLKNPEKLGLAGEVFVLAWTTTPWTLPGNVALAINRETIYCEVESLKLKVKSGEEISGRFILAKNRLGEVLKNYEYSVTREMKGEELIGLEYEPLFDYYAQDETLKNRENGWKIYGADFVTTEDGTGIVHIAPAFGEDDYNLSQKHNLPFVQHVGTNGLFKSEVKDFKGLPVKPIEDPTKTDVEIIKFLAHHGKLFSKEKITHSYPFCWRCDTPLINYAASSWFVKVTALRHKLVAANRKITWVPEDVKEGRFGKWLEGARDWAISRSRFWGAPLPVWRCERCQVAKVLGGLEEIKANLPARNQYYILRHGESESNLSNLVSSRPDNPHSLTKKGKLEAQVAGKEVSQLGIDLVFVSDFVRTQETAKIVAKIAKISKKNIITDSRLGELKGGVFEGKTWKEYDAFFSSKAERFYKCPEGGETELDLKKRITSFLYEVEEKHQGKKILIVSHDDPLFFLNAGALGLTQEEALDFPAGGGPFIKTGELRKLEFSPLPHNENFDRDFHRPFIDLVKLPCVCGGEMSRVPEVFDCWFESGAMPYGSNHYPFENLDRFDPKPSWFRPAKGFPANFIAEGQDQTRGWFYSMLVLGVALFNRSPYERVIVNGTILAENGQKMSKRLKNYPDPVSIINKYGMDALRFYLFSSPVMQAQDICFSEKTVAEVSSKVGGRLLNAYKFFEMYAGQMSPEVFDPLSASHPLDRWVLARLSEVTREVTEALDCYTLDAAARPIALFVDDLSTWYIRRSRNRFKFEILNPKFETNSNIQSSKNEEERKLDQQMALQTTRFVLLEFAKIIAPFMPFLAEDIYQEVKPFNDGAGDLLEMPGKESVHLEKWPEISPKSKVQSLKILEEMEEVRRVVSLGLEARARANLKVRQPLKELRIKNLELRIRGQEQLLDLIKDEVNVKAVVFDETLTAEVELDTEITPVLRTEGQIRELVRQIQDMRKEAGLNPKDSAVLSVSAGRDVENLIKAGSEEIKQAATLERIIFEDQLIGGKEFRLEDSVLLLKIN